MIDGYEIEFGRLDRRRWEDVARSFDDGSIFQSWSWGTVRRGDKNLDHVVLKNNGRVVAAAQAWIIRLPFLEKGIAYVKWGPMWRTTSDGCHIGHYRYMIRALRREYTENRGLLLRVTPKIAGEWAEEICSTLFEEGFRISPNSTPYRTILIDLSHSGAELRDGLKRQWRQCLNKAERNALEVRSGTGEELFDTAVSLYREMHERKRFAEFMDIEEMKTVQRFLPEQSKMDVFVCESGGTAVSACIVSRIGDTAIGLFAATGKDGFALHSSHLLQWRIVERLKASGCRWYDLGGIDPDNCAGTYLFKVGLSGKMGRDTLFNDYDFSSGISSRIAVGAGDRLRSAHRTFKEWTARLRQTDG